MALSERTTLLYLKTPERKWLWLGGVAACALPIILGVLMLLPFVFQHPVEVDEYYIVILPVGITFIFGSIFACLLGCWRVKKNAHEGFSTSGKFLVIGIGSATWAHFVAVILWSAFAMGDATGAIITVFLMFAIMHLVLWVFITIPLAAVCTLIFQSVATEERIVKLAEKP